MILYFSGTGNSEYVAQRIKDIVDDEILNLFTKIKHQDYTAITSTQPWIIVAPTYGWRIPRILEAWLNNTELLGNKDIYFVMTCGGDIGNATKYIEKLVQAKAMNYKGVAEIIMPENYLALFSTPSQNEARAIIQRAEVVIDKTGELIKQHATLPQKSIKLKDKLSSGIVNDLFYSLFVHDKKFYTTDKCVGCKKCAQICPLNNITIKDGKPAWLKNCTHCMACIARCPTKAIEYGKRSKGKERYTFPNNK